MKRKCKTRKPEWPGKKLYPKSSFYTYLNKMKTDTFQVYMARH